MRVQDMFVLVGECQFTAVDVEAFVEMPVVIESLHNYGFNISATKVRNNSGMAKHPDGKLRRFKYY